MNLPDSESSRAFCGAAVGASISEAICAEIRVRGDYDGGFGA